MDFFTTYDHLLIRTAKISAQGTLPPKEPFYCCKEWEDLSNIIMILWKALLLRDMMFSLLIGGAKVIPVDLRINSLCLYIDNFDSYTKDLKKFISLNPKMARPVILWPVQWGVILGSIMPMTTLKI